MKYFLSLLIAIFVQPAFADMVIIKKPAPTPSQLLPPPKPQKPKPQTHIKLRYGNITMLHYDFYRAAKTSWSGNKLNACEAAQMISPAGFSVNCRSHSGLTATWKRSNTDWLTTLNRVAIITKSKIEINFKDGVIDVL